MESSRVACAPWEAVAHGEQDGQIAMNPDRIVEERLRSPSDNMRPLVRQLGDDSITNRRIRADNRQARMIDGFLMNPRLSRRLLTPPTSMVGADEGHSDEKKKNKSGGGSVRRSLTPVWQKRNSSRTSSGMRDNLRKMFRRDDSASQASKAHNNNNNGTLDSPDRSLSTPANLPHGIAGITPRTRPAYPLGLDGAGDSLSPEEPKPAITKPRFSRVLSLPFLSKIKTQKNILPTKHEHEHQQTPPPHPSLHRPLPLSTPRLPILRRSFLHQRPSAKQSKCQHYTRTSIPPPPAERTHPARAAENGNPKQTPIAPTLRRTG